jgi:hypothetical protein
VLVPIMGVGTGLVAVLMLMLVLVVAAHPASPPFLYYLLNNIRNTYVTVKRNLAQSRGQVFLRYE